MKKIITIVCFIIGIALNAQVKVGNNPTTLATDANLQVEGTAPANQFVVMKNGQVGIGTLTPSNQLHIKSTSNPLRLQGVQTGTITDSILTTNGTGVVRKVEIGVVRSLNVGQIAFVDKSIGNNLTAKIGDPTKPFKHPWAARDSIVAKIKRAEITSGLIEVNPGIYTVSNFAADSPDYFIPAGSYGVRRYDTVASASTALYSASLLYSNVSYYLKYGAEIQNKGTDGMLLSDGNSTVTNCAITGSGTLTSTRNQNSAGGNTDDYYLRDINTEIYVEAHTLNWRGIGYANVINVKNYTLKAVNLNTPSRVIYSLGITALDATHTIDIVNYNVGKFAPGSDFIVADYWTPFMCYGFTGATPKRCNINVKMENVRMEESEGMFFLAYMDTCNWNVEIKNFFQESQSRYKANTGALLFTVGGAQLKNSNLTFNIGNYTGDIFIGRLEGILTNTKINFNCTNCNYDNDVSLAKPLIRVAGTTDSLSRVTFTGNYQSQFNNLIDVNANSNTIFEGKYKATGTNYPIYLNVSAPNVLFSGGISSASKPSIDAVSSSSQIVITPSAFSNLNYGSNVTPSGAILSVNSLFKF